MSERILVASSTFPQFEGDPRGLFIRQHWELRARAGAHVRVLVPRSAWSRDDLRSPLDVHRFRYAPRAVSVLTGHFGMLENIRERAWRAALLPAFFLASRRALRHHIRAFRPDLVVAHMFVPGGWSVARACVDADVPFEIFGHGTDVDVVLRLPTRLRHALLRVLGGARTIHLPSHEKLGRLRAAMPIELSADRLRVEPMVHATPMPEGPDSSDARGSGPARVLFVGRLIAQKGVDVLLHALARLDGVPVDVAGDGPERPRLERLARRLGVDATFHGFVAGEPKWSLFRRAALLCVPSREHRGLSEGAPLVIEEARAMGLFVVATTTGGIPELCAGRGETALVPAGDPAALAAALAAALSVVLVAVPGRGATDRLRRTG